MTDLPQSNVPVGTSEQPVFRRDAMHRIVVTFACLIVYGIGMLIPAPGVDVSALSRSDTLSLDALSRLSVFSLGAGPLIAALIFARVLGYITGRPGVMTFRVLLFALAIATLQAYSIANALAEIKGANAVPLVQDGPAFRLGFIGSFVAATAVLSLLADIITRQGIGSGLWVLYFAPVLQEAWPWLREATSMVAQGRVQLGELVTLVAAAALGLCAIVAAYRATLPRDAGRHLAGQHQHLPLAAMMWAAIIATTFGGYASALSQGLTSYFGWVHSGSTWFANGSPSAIVLLVLLIALVMRFELPEARGSVRMAATGSLGLAIVALAAAEALTGYFFFARPAEWAGIVLLMLASLDALRAPAAQAATSPAPAARAD